MIARVVLFDGENLRKLDVIEERENERVYG